MTDDARLDLATTEYPTPELVECPYAFYAQLREEAPVHRLPNGDYVLTRWQDIACVSRHLDLFSCFLGKVNPDWGKAFASDEDTGEEKLSPWPLPFTDPPEHRLKRQLMQQLVTRDRLKSFEPMIREVSDQLIDAFVDLGEVDFKAAFADELPPLVMLRIFDVPKEDEAMIRGWMLSSQGQGFRHATEEQKRAQVEGLTNARAYFRETILDRQANPRPDFLSDLVKMKVERDGQLDLRYLVGEVTNLYSAAYHNTVYMLASTLELLLRNSSEMQRVREDPTLIRFAIEESLRLESPVQWLQRVTLTDVEIEGVVIPEGSVVLLMYGAANRDERKFDDPERFWVERPWVARDQLGFGDGPRLCVGAPLARLEGEIAFEQLLKRLKRIRLSDRNDYAHVTTVNHRGPKALHIEFEKA
ncbi:MAG: cytochrome P450 [Actinobacteria bacterium]|nr:cytochrome P450 [Actinomycetota bacterium]